MQRLEGVLRRLDEAKATLENRNALSKQLDELKNRIRELRKQLEDYADAETEHDEVMAFKEFLGAYYHNCGNRRLDRHMLAIQGQQLLLRYIYASCIPQRAADIEILQQMLLDTMNGDADAVCATLQTYSDQMTRVVETAVTEL